MTQAPAPDAAGYGGAILPAGVTARFVEGVNGLRMHVLEAGAGAGRPLLMLLHGFPELAWSWRKVMPALAEGGYHVVAPDQRGYGLTTGWADGYETDLRPFGMLGLVRDAVGLVAALGHDRAAGLIGHDFGSPVAAWAALLRPDIFRAVALMSAPFGGPPDLPEAARGAGRPGGGGAVGAPPSGGGLAEARADLPQPRKHYQHYYATRDADADMRHAPQGLHAFLRAYYHVKSADWPGNQPHALADWSAVELAQLPTYYVMDLARTMAETVAPHMPPPAQVAACEWLTEADLAVYAERFAATGFQGGLNWYRAAQAPAIVTEQQLFAGRGIEVPACYIAGAADWGIYQSPGALERMEQAGCRRFLGRHLVPNAGHWVQQEQPDATARLLRAFLAEAGS